jgi:peptidoglycan-associated lipoprotein
VENELKFMKRVLILLSLVAFGLISCKTTEKPSYAGTDGDYINGTPLPQRQEGVSFFSNNVQKGQFPPVYFAFDSFEISAQEGEKLKGLADFLRSARNNIILAGFTDERGTPEYNRALGERRAQAARNYLLSLRVSPARIQTVSFGQEMPADPGHSESAWAKNRRVETGVVR